MVRKEVNESGIHATQKRRASANKARHREAEVAAEHWLREQMHCVAIRRAVRTKWQRVDFFGADLVGVLCTGAHVYVQVTTGAAQAVSVRRRKLEGFPWHPSDTVLLLNLVVTESPAKGRRKEFWFRAEELITNHQENGMRSTWQDWEESIPVPREWFRKAKDEACQT